MAREFAKMRLDMWVTGDVCKLTPPAQHLYWVLLTHTELSYCGVTDWRPGRLAAKAAGWTADHVRSAAAELVRTLWIVVDEDTEEVLLRTFIRDDELMKQSRVAVSMAKAYGAVASPKLRGVIVHELRRLRAEEPELNGWRTVSGGPGPALALLSLDAINPASLVDGLGDALPAPLPEDLGQGFAQTQPNVSATVSGSASTATATATATSPSEEGERPTQPRKRGCRCPDDYTPGEDLRQWAEDRGFTDAAIADMTAEFVDYWRAKSGKDATKLDWDGTWRNWVRKEDPDRRNRRVRPVLAVAGGSPRGSGIKPWLA